MGTYVIGDVHARPHLVEQLIRDVPWDIRNDKIVFLGDLIDRGPDAQGVVELIKGLVKENPNIVVLRGNHEQMLLDCIDYQDPQWLVPENGGLTTIASYGYDLDEIDDVTEIRIPEEHVEFLRSLPFYHEDEQAIYVHAGLVLGEHPSETDPDVLMWTRDVDFYRSYSGKVCFFGHTPTQYLPRDRRQRRFAIYIHGSCVGLDTSGEAESPLSCIQVETFTLYQAHPSGKTEVERLRSLKPVPNTSNHHRYSIG